MRIGQNRDATGSGLRPRFGLRALLVFVALCAAALTGGRQWMLLQNVQSEYYRTRAAWMADVVVADDVELAAKNLYQREAATLWIGRSAAVCRQVERLHELADTMDAMSRHRLYGSREGLERDQNRVEELRRTAAELSPPNGVEE